MPDVIRGNAVVFTQGGPTAVINASWVGVVEGLMGAEEITGVYGAIKGIDGILNQDFVDLAAQDPYTLQAISCTPATQLLSTRHKPTAEDNAAMLKIFELHNIRYVFGIGGNDTSEALDIIRDAVAEQDYELRFFHIAKTVDCDLMENDHTPGYASAARYVANALRGCDLDNRCFGGLYLAVCMGRHAGFLTAASVLGRATETSGPHLVYVPEVVFDIERFCKDVWKVYEKEGRCVVVVSEGIEDRNGTPILQVLSDSKLEADSHGNPQLSGTGALADALVDKIKEYFAGHGIKHLRARGDTLGYIQRSFPDQSPVDREESLGLGKFAAQQALAGKSGGSCAIVRVADDPYKCEFRLVPLKNVAGKTRLMPAEFINHEGNNLTPAFLQWGTPLIGALPPVGILDMSKSIAKR